MTASRDLEELSASLAELQGLRDGVRLEEASRDRAVGDSLGALARAEERFTGEGEASIDAFDRVRLAMKAADEERSRLVRSIEERDGLLRCIHQRIGAPGLARGAGLTSVKAFVTAAERDIAELRRHDAWMGELGARLELALGVDPTLDPGAARTAEGLRAVAAELEWRKAELAAARAAGGASRARLLAGPLAGQLPAEEGGVKTVWAPLPLDRASAEQAASTPLEQAAPAADEQAPPASEERASFTEEEPEEDHGRAAEAAEAADDAVVVDRATMEPPAPLPSLMEETEARP